MARQEGVLKMKGRIGDIIYYKNKNGYFTRHKGTLDVKRVTKDPKFENSRKASTSFGKAGGGSGTLRAAMGEEAFLLRDGSHNNRLVSRLAEILNSDPNPDRATKEIANGNLQLLRGMDWVAARPLRNIVTAPFEILVDRTSGQVSIHFKGLKGSQLKGG